MAYYHFHGLIPDGGSQSEGYKMFEEYIASSALMDNFDGFELKSRFHAPQLGRFLLLLKLIIIWQYRNISEFEELNFDLNGI